MKDTPTSPYVPDLDQLRAWIEQMVAAMRFVELVVAIIHLISRMRDINAELTKRVAQLTRERPRSETLERLERQLTLPGLDSTRSQAKKKKTDAREPKKSRRGVHPGRGALPAHLPRVQVKNPVPEDQRRCPICGGEMTVVGHSICERLTVIPARIIVEQRLDETLACPRDDAIVSAAPPPAIVERGKLGDALIIEATCDKYIEYLPIERQCRRWARAGIDLAPQTLGRSVAAHIDLLMPIARGITERTRAPGLLGTDATGIPILDPSTESGIRTGAIWAWTNARWVTFFYSPSGDSDSVRRFLGDDLCRTVQCDGTSVTTFIERAGGKRPGCWSHARRGFVEAARLGDAIAVDALHTIAPLFAIEKAATLAGDNAEARRKRRLEHSQPVLDRIRAFLDEHRATTPPKTPLGRALGYLHRQWNRLVLFVEDGNIELTNNRRERELRKLVLGRKNWLFAWDDIGGVRTAAILTIIATCITHDIDPRAYLHLVTRLIVEGWPQKRLRDLFPDRILAAHPELAVSETRSLAAAPAPDALLLAPRA